MGRFYWWAATQSAVWLSVVAIIMVVGGSPRAAGVVTAAMVAWCWVSLERIHAVLEARD
jgi:hypothetical protein